MRFEGSVAVITGGAGGIGSYLAGAFVEEGASVVLIDIRTSETDSVVADLAARGNRVMGLTADVRKREELERAREVILAEFARVDVLITCAGIAQQCRSLELSVQDWVDMVDTNLNGTFFSCQVFGQHMCHRGGGKIILVGSKSGLIVTEDAFHAHYNASKAGVIHLARCLAAEWAPFAVSVNCISPGYILTPMTRDRVDRHPAWISRIPLGKLGQPRDLRGAVMYLASDASDYATGTNLVIDGGYTLW